MLLDAITLLAAIAFWILFAILLNGYFSGKSILSTFFQRDVEPTFIVLALATAAHFSAVTLHNAFGWSADLLFGIFVITPLVFFIADIVRSVHRNKRAQE